MSLELSKSIDMFLKCSWIAYEFSFQKLLATLRKLQAFNFQVADLQLY